MHHRNLSPGPSDRAGPKSVAEGVVRYLLRPMATLPPDLVLHQLGKKDRTAADQLKLFHLALVVLDPYTYESSWLLETGARILSNFAGADVRAAFLLTCDEAGATEFLGPHTDEFMCFVDPDREVVKALGLKELPAFVHVALDLTIVGTAEGWDPETWRPIIENLADVMSWSRPQVPKPGDPVPFEGTNALV
jgi:hypothetical protein